LKVAGYRGTSLFKDEAVEMIASSSEGIPRNINNICFNALSIGFALQTKRIGRVVIEEVLEDRNIELLLSHGSAGKGPVSSKSFTSVLEIPSFSQHEPN